MDNYNNSSTESSGLTESDENFNTIFDDVFRTIAQKMPFYNVPYKVDTARERDCLKC